MDFKISKSMTSRRPFCTFSLGALSWLLFCSDFLQNLRRGRKLSFTVWYLKSARSLGIFRKYGGPRFRKKKIKMDAKNKILETRQVRCLFHSMVWFQRKVRIPWYKWAHCIRLLRLKEICNVHVGIMLMPCFNKSYVPI